MDAPVLGEVGVLPESLPALRTLIGLLIRVCLVVLEELRVGGKALPTLGTLVGPLPSVDPLVAD